MTTPALELRDGENGYDVMSLPRRSEKMVARTEALPALVDKSNIDSVIEEDRKSFYDGVEHQYLRCFHGSLSRSQADKVLSQSGPGKIAYGKFLIRKSDKLTKHIILSIVRQDRICHFPIQLKENGTFSVGGETVLNFDDMYEYCKTYGREMFKVAPTEPVIKDFLPPELWKNGKTTILHKVVESGTETMLRMVLDHPKCLPLGVKNEEGNTPLHIACYMGRDDIVQLLLSRKASPALLNAYGWNSLHMAALGNNPSTIRILHEQGNCDLSGSNPVNMYTALHCAAACDNSESIEMLLTLGADASQETDGGKNALKLAETFGALDAVKILGASKGKNAVRSIKEEWYINEACRLEQFIDGGQIKLDEGTFFVRPSVSNPSGHTICIAWDGKWVHVSIRKKEQGYLVLGGVQPSETLGEAVTSFLSQFKNVLHPISPAQAEALRKAAERSRVGLENGVAKKFAKGRPPERRASDEATENPLGALFRQRVHRHIMEESSDEGNNRDPGANATEALMHQDPNLMHFQSFFPAGNNVPFLPGNMMPLKQPPPSELPKAGAKWPSIGLPDLKGLVVASIFSLRSKARNIPTISASQVQTGKFLGEGNYGRVYDGYFVDNYSFTHPVAIKVLKDSLNGTQRNEFLEEATVMRRLTHPFIVRLYGVVSNKNDLWMIQELLPLGSLHSYLHANRNADLSDKVLLWTAQVADGMRYMESKHYVHRDLAARNLLLASLDRVKISDFGLSRYTGDEDLYVQHSMKAIPIAWYAPEAFTYFTFTNKSDVWSFAVTVWEMYTKCEQPYSEINGDPNFLLPYIMAGNRLGRPLTCSLDTWNLLFSCWNIYPELRPSFERIASTLEALPEYFNAVNAVKRVSMSS